jgi:Mn2+/Fe2+ NRAMP family transporter
MSCVAFVYLLTVFIVDASWKEIAKATIIPHIELSFAFLLIATGNIGTTIAPYLFFWEASEEVEEDHHQRMISRDGEVSISDEYIKKIRLDNGIGMLISQIITWSIIVVAATVLHGNGITNITSAADAAKALEPLVGTFPYAGFLAKIFFAIGIIGAGLLVVPILSGSTAYAIAETVGWKEGFDLKLKKARGFYGVITVATIIGLIVNFLGIDPIRLLIYVSVLNGLAALPLIFLIGKISASKKIMGRFRGKTLSKIFISLAFLVMAILAFGMIFTF